MEREGCCTKPCIQGLVWHDCCANESFVHAGIPATTPGANKGETAQGSRHREK